MPKRKRDGNQTEEGLFSHIADHATRLVASRFKAHFDNGVKSLTAQIKLARAFDRQKMTRRLKQAGSDPIKLERLQVELAVLKDLDTGAVASNYLLKQCIKTKKIRECSGFIAVFGEDAEARLKGTGSVAEANVLGRLFKSNPVSEVLPSIMRDIRTVLNVDGTAPSVLKELASTEQNGNGFALEDAEEFGGFSDSLSENRAGTELLLDDSEALDEQDEEVLDVYDARLAASSDSESELEEDDQDHSPRGDSMSITSEEADGGEGSSDHDSKQSFSSYSKSEESENLIHPVKSNELSNSKTTSKSSSMNPVLPALMNGGYYSGSESASDFDPDKDIQVAAMTTARKNRRGQRARQAIAEKKHGNRAKHLLKMNNTKPGQVGKSRSTGKRGESGWDTRRGAVDAPRDSRSHGRGPTTNKHDRRNGSGRQLEGNADPSRASSDRRQQGKAITNASEKPLHPSWEAARKKKLESASGGSNFAGKKITFD